MWNKCVPTIDIHAIPIDSLEFCFSLARELFISIRNFYSFCPFLCVCACVRVSVCVSAFFHRCCVAFSIQRSKSLQPTCVFEVFFSISILRTSVTTFCCSFTFSYFIFFFLYISYINNVFQGHFTNYHGVRLMYVFIRSIECKQYNHFLNILCTQ